MDIFFEYYMDYDLHVYTRSLQPYDRSPDMRRQCYIVDINDGFDYLNGQFDDLFSPRDRYPGYSDENSAFRWQKAI